MHRTVYAMNYWVDDRAEDPYERACASGPTARATPRVRSVLVSEDLDPKWVEMCRTSALQATNDPSVRVGWVTSGWTETHADAPPSEWGSQTWDAYAERDGGLVACVVVRRLTAW